VPGEDHHRRRLLLALQALQDLEPVHERHLDVEEDEVGVFLLRDLEPGRPVGREQALVALVLEDHLERGADGFLVVDDEDLGLHRRPSTSILVRNVPAGRGR
jgi:hypothetical protein